MRQTQAEPVTTTDGVAMPVVVLHLPHGEQQLLHEPLLLFVLALVLVLPHHKLQSIAVEFPVPGRPVELVR